MNDLNDPNFPLIATIIVEPFHGHDTETLTWIIVFIWQLWQRKIIPTFCNESLRKRSWKAVERMSQINADRRLFCIQGSQAIMGPT